MSSPTSATSVTVCVGNISRSFGPNNVWWACASRGCFFVCFVVKLLYYQQPFVLVCFFHLPLSSHASTILISCPHNLHSVHILAFLPTTASQGVSCSRQDGCTGQTLYIDIHTFDVDVSSISWLIVECIMRWWNDCTFSTFTDMFDTYEQMFWGHVK